MEIIGRTSIDFIGRRHIAYVVSGVLILVGLVATVQVWRGRANLGVDFTGGTTMQVRFEKAPEVGEVRRALAAVGLDPELQTLEGGDRLLIRLRKAEAKQEGGQGGTAQQVEEALRKGIPEAKFAVEGTNEVGPAIGRELLAAAQKAILVSLIGIILYIWWRFEFTFGVAATIATFHDVLAVLGVVWVLDREITFLTISALLTLAGYSLTDTVVVYDRIRENLRGRRRGNFGEVINGSINEVLGRTAMVSLTTLLAVLSILILGGAVLWDFAFALALGIIVGTYSSWFVASPIVYEWRTRLTARPTSKK